MKNAESAQNFNKSHNLTIFQQWNEHQCDDVTQTQIYLGNFDLSDDICTLKILGLDKCMETGSLKTCQISLSGSHLWIIFNLGKVNVFSIGLFDVTVEIAFVFVCG